MLQILHYKFHIDLVTETFVCFYHLGQILPASGRNENLAVNRGPHIIEILAFEFKIRHDRTMDSALVCVFFPNIIIRLHINALNTVKCYYIEITDGFVIFRRVAGCHDNPALGNTVISETLALQKLKHCRRKCLRYAVDLIDKKNTLL